MDPGFHVVASPLCICGSSLGGPGIIVMIPMLWGVLRAPYLAN